MRGSFAVLVVVLLTGAVAEAQVEPSSPKVQQEIASGASIVSAPPSGYRAFDDDDLREAEARSRRVRNALMGTSAGAALGGILLGIGISQCSTFERFPEGTTEVVCNRAGNVLGNTGIVMVMLSAIGMITTGAMLGVRNRDRRRIERDVYRRSGLHWDERGRLVF